MPLCPEGVNADKTNKHDISLHLAAFIYFTCKSGMRDVKLGLSHRNWDGWTACIPVDSFIFDLWKINFEEDEADDVISL